MSELKSYQPERVSVRFKGCEPDANAFRLIGLAEYLKFNLSHPMKVSDIGRMDVRAPKNRSTVAIMSLGSVHDQLFDFVADIQCTASNITQGF